MREIIIYISVSRHVRQDDESKSFSSSSQKYSSHYSRWLNMSAPPGVFSSAYFSVRHFSHTFSVPRKPNTVSLIFGQNSLVPWTLFFATMGIRRCTIVSFSILACLRPLLIVLLISTWIKAAFVLVVWLLLQPWRWYLSSLCQLLDSHPHHIGILDERECSMIPTSPAPNSLI